MKQTETGHNEPARMEREAGADEPLERGSGEQPRSWRKYIEETEAAEKKAEREAAKARAAQNRAGKKRFQPKALAEKAQAALNEARAVGRRAKEEPVKERAARAAQSVRSFGAESWERVCDFTADGWDKVSAAWGKVRDVVERHPVSPLLYVTLFAVIVGVIAFRSTYTLAYAVNYNGQELGVVSSEDDVKAIVSNVESRASDILGEDYAFEAEISVAPVYVVPGELSDTAQIEETLFEDVGALVQAYSLRVDGTELGCAATEEELKALLDEAAAPYLTENTVSYEFVEDVEIAPVELPSNTRFDLAPIRATLAEMRVEQSTYVVKKGDTFNAIAYSLDMWPYELSVLNPDVIVDKLWVDQELIIQEAVPFLSVQNITDETYEQAVPSPVEYIETAELYVGDTRVKEQGEDGLERVNAHVTYVNGVEVEREIVATETLKEPTTTYSYTGTTPRPVTASNGYFIWPVRGTITSNFGGRNLWGRYDFHLGLDIACRTGTAIKAADGGTVIKSGWSGSYGKLVAIRHDNGYVTYYAHNSQLLVNVGDKVYQGQIIARSGATGNVSGPHCHFEVRINNTSVNPRNYLQ
ncbi:MAG: peptidoglycan DD-metalloendopeptidase family protein [Oscillospiraceae bacterium]|nr:peptidoglycan DD-metalloendopeptidase family protein [Oscillospiraceae bacterium]